MKNQTSFKAGNNFGRPKGAQSKTTKEAKELFISIMQGEVSNIQDALTKVRKKDPARYLDTISRLFPYFMPKQLDITTEGQSFPAPQIILNGANRAK